MDITQRLSQWAENDMRAEDVALTAKYEIERLREEKKVIATHGLKQISEIQRLREALKYYAQRRLSYDCGEKARSALQQKDTER